MDESLLYNPSEVADRIDQILAEKGMVKKSMLKDLGLSINTTSNMRNGRAIASDSLARIADYLQVSTDFLLGRTSQPAAEPEVILSNDDEPIDEVKRKLHEIIDSLSASDKEAMLYMAQSLMKRDEQKGE